MPDDVLTSVEARLIGAAVESVRGDMADMKLTVKELSATLSRLADTGSALERAFKKIEDIDGRIRHIEITMPSLIETRKWVIAMAALALTLVMTAVVALVLHPPVTTVYTAVPTPILSSPPKAP